MQRMRHRRSGISLVEVILALTLASVLGATATAAFVAQSRFFDAQEKVDFARGVSRGAMNMMVTELRMLEQEHGIASATRRRITVRAPYALGVVCGNVGALTISRLPADPLVLETAAYSGLAYRNRATGRYTYVEDNSTKPTPFKPAEAICAAAGISIYKDHGGDSDGRVLQGALLNPAPAIGAPVFLYQRVTYEFKASVTVPGRTGLWRRTEETGLDEELVAPFDTTAGFRFYVNDGAVPTAAVPAEPGSITGIELNLDGLTEHAGNGGAARSVPLTTSVFFRNRLSP
jgi:type II secretory pathway pseudopilin PulG